MRNNRLDKDTKVVFLDVDGVLNCYYTHDSCEGYTGIDDAKVALLKQIIDSTGAIIVLVSTWKEYWEDGNPVGVFGEYLVGKLEAANLTIYDKTEDYIGKKTRRGTGIKTWLKEHGLEDCKWVLLDDEVFADYYDVEGLFDHLVSTEYYAVDGGLQQTHVDLAIKILS